MSDQSKREILKSIAVGSGAILVGKSLPEGWMRPIVDSVILPSHANTTDDIEPPCEPCLDAATYCEGAGQGSPEISVAVDGTVTLTHPNGTDTATVDPCTGGAYQFELSATGSGTITLVGTIPCGVTESIQVTVTEGTKDPVQETYTKDACLPG